MGPHTPLTNSHLLRCPPNLIIKLLLRHTTHDKDWLHGSLSHDGVLSDQLRKTVKTFVFRETSVGNDAGGFSDIGEEVAVCEVRFEFGGDLGVYTTGGDEGCD